ncbi:intein C-terminal splicing protein [Leptospira interrogans serovar Manilae]|nr:intein C-terminal splicing protein [Leptospira interrogans serovar Manilae]
MEAHGLKTKTVKTKDKYSGEDISTTYVLDENGNIRTFKDEDGVEKQMTVGDWIASDEGCGKSLTNGKCNQYIENKYESVAIGSDGTITANRKIYNGTTSQCGADFAQASSYCYNEDDRVVTIAPPNPKALLLGRGASRLGDIFDGRDNGIGELVNTTFQNVGTYLSSNRYTDGLFYDVKNAQMESDHNASIAANDVSNKVKIANLIVDYAEAVLYGGMSTSSWVTKQAHQAVQDVMATALVNTFDFSPEVASFLSGALITREVARHEKSSFAVQNLGINHAIHEMAEALNRSDLKFLSVGELLESINVGPNAEKLRAVQDWKDFKYQTYAFGIQQIGKANGLPPETSAAISQAVVSHLRMQSVKEELGMRSGAYSLNAVGGVVRGVLNGIESLLGEIIGGVVLKGLAHVSKEAGLTSHGYEHTYDKGVQQRIDLLKHREGKEIIKQAAANDVAAYGAIVQAVGDDLHLDPAVTENWVKMTTEFVSRKQAESELRHRNGFWGGQGAIPVVTWVDNTIFNGAITTLLAKAVKGVTVTVGDIGHFISPKSDTFRHSMYQQGNNFYNDMTSSDVKAKAQQGIINKAHLETEMRNQLFDAIGQTLMPGDKEAAHNLGLLLKHHIDQKEAKKAAREQRLKDTQMIVQVVAAAAATYFGGPAGIQMLNSIIGTSATAINTTLATVGLSLNNAQVAALAISTAVSIGVESSINGPNGAAAALVNGLISTVTMGVKTPITGYVSYTKHENANLLTGQHEVKGGWGGGISANIAGTKALPVGKLLQSFAEAMKMSNLSLGLSYNADAGLGMNVNTNFKSGLGLGLDYNFKNKDYTANGSYDFNNIGGNKWANANLGISASKNGHASFSMSYNSDGNTHIPQALRGNGATLDFGNDGLIGLSVQGPKGATVGTLTYDTNTHGFEPVSFNHNFQNEFNQGQAAENAAYNHQKGQMEILMKELSLGTKMDKPLFTQAEIDKALPKDEHGNLDMEKADPEKLLDKWNAHKEAMSKTPEGLQKWKDEVSKAGERSGIEVKFNEGKSATSTFGKFVTGLMGDVAQSFGFTNDGSKMVDKAGVFHLDTCFVAGSKITKLKNKNIKIYENTNILSTSNGANLSGFNSEDYEFANIEEIRIGDVVRSWNENTNTFENKRVTETFVHKVPQLFFLELDGEEEIHTTWNHPFRRYRATQESETNRNERQSAGYGVERGFENHSVEHSRNVALENRDMTETSHLTPNQLAPNVSKLLATGNYFQSPRSEWVKVEDLRLRDQVLRSDGSWGTVTGIYYYNTEPTKVYNLEVEDNHTYVVGGSESGKGYVVHNYSKEHEAVFSKVKSLSKDMFDVAKQFAGMEGGTGNEAYQRAVKLEGEVKSTNALRESLKTESNAITLQRDKAEGSLELNKRRNNEFLTAIRNPDSDSIPGISELRKQLKSVDPVKGFTSDQIKAVTKWVNTNGLSSGLMNTGHGMGMLGGSPIKGYIAATAGNITGIDEHNKLRTTIQDSNTKLAEHKIKEEHIGRQMVERSNAAKADLVKFIQERHGNDPRFSNVLVEHGLVPKDSFNPNEHKVTYDEKLKAMGDKIKPETQKKLNEYTSKITDIRVKQNQLEAESYAQWNKTHPNEPYKRTPELEKRRNDMIAMQRNLEKERSTIVNREVAPFKNENELHRLEKLADASAITEKQKTELTNLRNEKKAHENQVAALLDKDSAKLHDTLENLDLKASKPMTVSTTLSRFENETIHKLRSKDNPATKELTWEGKTYQRNVNNQTGEVNFEREYKPGVKEEISVTDSGQIKQKLTWNNVLGNPQESVKVFDANGKFLTELSGDKPATVETNPNEKVTIKPNDPQGSVQRSDLNEVKNLISNTNLSSKERLSKINTLDEIEVNGKRYVKETVVTENVKTKNTKEKVTFFTLQNENGKSERISFEEVNSGYKDEKGKPIKTIEMVQVQSEGTVAEDTKRFDRFGNEKPDQDHAGNYPTIEENRQYYLERAKQIFQEKNIQPLLDGSGNLEKYNGNASLVSLANEGFMNISSLTQTQRDQSYLGQRDKNGKPVLYSLPGSKSGDVLDESACQSHGPATVLASLGFKMTPEQINQYGKLNVMITRMVAEAGQMLPHKPRPSEMSIQEISDLVLKPLGFEVPPGNEGALIAWGKDRPKEPDVRKYEFDPDGYEKAKNVYKQELRAFKLKFQEEHLNAWITKQLENGNIVVSGADFTAGGHVATFVGKDRDGWYSNDSYGDANTKYKSHDGKMNHYKFQDYALGYGYVIKKAGNAMTETERKTYLKDYTSFPGLNKSQSNLTSSIRSLENIVKNASDEKKRQESEQKLNELRKNLETTEEEIQRIKKTWGMKWDPKNGGSIFF